MQGDSCEIPSFFGPQEIPEELSHVEQASTSTKWLGGNAGANEKETHSRQSKRRQALVEKLWIMSDCAQNPKIDILKWNEDSTSIMEKIHIHDITINIEQFNTRKISA